LAKRRHISLPPFWFPVFFSPSPQSCNSSGISLYPSAHYARGRLPRSGSPFLLNFLSPPCEARPLFPLFLFSVQSPPFIRVLGYCALAPPVETCRLPSWLLRASFVFPPIFRSGAIPPRIWPTDSKVPPPLDIANAHCATLPSFSVLPLRSFFFFIPTTPSRPTQFLTLRGSALTTIRTMEAPFSPAHPRVMLALCSLVHLLFKEVFLYFSGSVVLLL